MTRGMVIGVVAGLIFVAASMWLSELPPFYPRDYEDCAERAATNAKSKEALKVLLDSCETRFVARRNGKGGYSYFDGRQNRLFPVRGSNPSPEEWAGIEKANAEYVATAAMERAEQRRREREFAKWEAETRRQQALAEAEANRKLSEKVAQERQEQERAKAVFEGRRSSASAKVLVSSKEVICPYKSLPGCDSYKLSATIKNQSPETLVGLAIGWVFLAENETECPSYIKTRHEEPVHMRPGDSAVLNIDRLTGGPSSKEFRYCVKVTEIQIAP